jgi:hypothetical protein
MPKRYSAPPMVDNPQLLVPLLKNHHTSKLRNNLSKLDAIYIPFKHRIEYVKTLLNELNPFEGPIYLLPTDDFNLQSFDSFLVRNTQVLALEDSSYRSFYTNLLTSKHRHTKKYNEIWDLPLKRNFVIQHALKMDYKKILLVDDDIRSISKQCLAFGANCLEDYVLAGCFVEDFLDTSVLGHLEKAAGEHIDPFLSGSFLFVRPHAVKGFFPCLYNEDWLFMIPHIMNGSICLFGSIRQVEFDPFSDMSRPLFQEFGEVMIEGLYALLAGKQYGHRHETKAWSDVIFQRREILRSLSVRLSEAKHQKTIATMLAANSEITPDDCCKFVLDWETDLESWKTYIKGFK